MTLPNTAVPEDFRKANRKVTWTCDFVGVPEDPGRFPEELPEGYMEAALMGCLQTRVIPGRVFFVCRHGFASLAPHTT